MNKFCHHIGILTANPDRLKKFYINKLGFKFEGLREINRKIIRKIFNINADCKLTRLKLDNVYLELFSANGIKLSKRLFGTAGYNHWALNVSDKVQFCRRMLRNKVKAIKVERSNYYIYFIQDPDGNLIEIRDNKS